ncbi:MAG TPA: UDP-glucose/GDP-mannose dehydrogenase family protein [Candidatus Hydrogenedentes bacterium]|nr:UDP-glucose/GDP-mannose dehydrogenase family protein [Candidatus Hydrogenedentota bacterium]HPO85979.1 UDP-glucose/GDP-mannose dehydrogenase family protein [Candidatus Hydrogenedentota bacterium]
MRVAVVGTGYVGLVVGTGLAEIGHFVTCADSDEQRIEQLLQGKLPIYEPGLEELLLRNAEEGRLSFTAHLAEAVENSSVIFICVGTPSGEEGEADVSAVMDVARAIGACMTGYRVIVIKSTCPVGTSDRVEELMKQLTSHPFDVVCNPEFLREGAAVDDFLRPDRVIIGCEDVRVEELMKELYRPVLRTGNPFLTMSRRSAELAKYACNALLAARIALLNEIACLCEEYGGDISAIREAAATDRRIGPQYLHPSLGFGGSCLPKDVAACAKLARDAGLASGILESILEANQRQQERFLQRILGYYGEKIGEKTLALWGVTFKARTDDVRGAPALRIIDALLERGATVRVYDPAAGDKIRSMYGARVLVASKCYEVLEGADGLIIPTEWREFQSPDYERMGQLMRERVIFDGRNLYSPRNIATYGFKYFSIGRAPI